jgi:hypothetical protein
VGAIMIASSPAARSEAQPAKASCVVVATVADMNAAVFKVEVECLWFAFSEGERCCRFGGVGEAMQLGQLEGAVGVCDVAQDAAGADRGELLIISDQSDVRTAIDGELDCGVQGQSVGHAGFVDDHEGRRPDPRSPIRQFAMAE